jgi:peptide/nickel transport system permease protein
MPGRPSNTEVQEGDTGRGQGVWQRLMRNIGARIGLVLVFLLVLVAVFAQYVSPYDPFKTDPELSMNPPSREHLCGTDNLGRDLLSRIIYGSRISLWVGIVATGVSVVVGVPFGLAAGYFGGKWDAMIMHLVEVLLAFPGILLALAIIAILGPNLVNVMIAVGIGGIPRYVRMVRGSVLVARELPYVEAAKTLGCQDSRVMFRHVLPNVLAPVIILTTLEVAGAILSASSLSFLGLGAQPPSPEWGALLSSARSFMRTAWWLTSFPGLAIMITVLSINLLGDGLRDALDPRLKT